MNLIYFVFILWHLLYFLSESDTLEVFKSLPGARGFVVIEYEPVASPGDSLHA